MDSTLTRLRALDPRVQIGAAVVVVVLVVAGLFSVVRSETPPVTVASTPTVEPSATAPRSSPTPEPGLWRLEGYIVDESGKPIENVCVVIGPVPCAQYSPHTDERGHYFVDIAAVGSQTVLLNYDFYFEIPGRQTVWLRMTPTGSTTFNAVLKRT